MRDPKLEQRIRELTAALREYTESDPMIHVRGLLKSLDASYKEQLADVAAEDLPRVQGALKQVHALHDAIFGPEGMLPRL